MPGLRQLLRILLTGRQEGLRRRLLRRIFGVGEAAEPAHTGPASTPEPALAGRLLAQVSELADGDVIEVMVDGEPVALCRVGDAFYAVEGTCPHAGGPLGDGHLEGTTLTCPYHGWQFDISDGHCLMDDALSVERLPVSVDNGRVVLLRSE